MTCVWVGTNLCAYKRYTFFIHKIGNECDINSFKFVDWKFTFILFQGINIDKANVFLSYNNIFYDMVTIYNVSMI